MLLLSELIFPPKCVFCGQVMEIGTTICICASCAPAADELRCGAANGIANAFGTQYCDGMAAVYEYRGLVRQAVTEFKFQGKPSYFRSFSAEMAQALASPGNRQPAHGLSFMVSVPMHRKKERARGYNQAKLLSEGISRITGVPERSDLLTKPSDTRTQHLGAEIARFDGMAGSYAVRGLDEVRGADILIIDDVITTGSTINECARALKLAGAKKVWGLAYATNKKELIH